MVSPIGIGHESYWDSLYRQRSGVRSAASYDAGVGLPVCIGGAIPDFDGKLYVKPRKALKVMSPRNSNRFLGGRHGRQAGAA